MRKRYRGHGFYQAKLTIDRPGTGMEKRGAGAAARRRARGEKGAAHGGGGRRRQVPAPVQRLVGGTVSVGITSRQLVSVGDSIRGASQHRGGVRPGGACDFWPRPPRCFLGGRAGAIQKERDSGRIVALKMAADKHGLTISDLLRQLIEDQLKRDGISVTSGPLPGQMTM